MYSANKPLKNAMPLKTINEKYELKAVNLMAHL
jgi:hypothetical protein